MENCISCGKGIKVIANSVKFPCPCCKKEICRCRICRTKGALYKCECGFIGP